AGRATHRRPPRLAAHVQAGLDGPPLPRSPGHAGGDLPARDRRSRGARLWTHGRASGSRADLGRLSAVDALRVLDPPGDLPLRARGRPRGALSLDRSRRAPRPPQRSSPAGHAPFGQRAGLVPVPGRVLAHARAADRVRRRHGVPHRLPRLRHDALLPAPRAAALAARALAARAPHAPPLPGPRARLRHQCSVLGQGVRHAGAAGRAGRRRGGV
ncbi:MAG: Sphingolipid (R)-alpha-hydroxylase FAH1 (no EC), partial [uncultured Solirubrobacterales bacterium]